MHYLYSGMRSETRIAKNPGYGKLTLLAGRRACPREINSMATALFVQRHSKRNANRKRPRPGEAYIASGEAGLSPLQLLLAAFSKFLVFCLLIHFVYLGFSNFAK